MFGREGGTKRKNWSGNLIRYDPDKDGRNEKRTKTAHDFTYAKKSLLLESTLKQQGAPTSWFHLPVEAVGFFAGSVMSRVDAATHQCRARVTRYVPVNQ
ncbi:hypothetical protein HN011_006963 [Eciton burchellii]|nr:hypothetical protein HN011_006963 [Eciton burchellii]